MGALQQPGPADRVQGVETSRDSRDKLFLFGKFLRKLFGNSKSRSNRFRSMNVHQLHALSNGQDQPPTIRLGRYGKNIHRFRGLRLARNTMAVPMVLKLTLGAKWTQLAALSTPRIHLVPGISMSGVNQNPKKRVDVGWSLWNPTVVKRSDSETVNLLFRCFQFLTAIEAFDRSGITASMTTLTSIGIRKTSQTKAAVRPLRRPIFFCCNSISKKNVAY